MARKWAEKIYKGMGWRRTRETYFKKKFGLCEKCGAPGDEIHHIEFLTEENINDPEIVYGEDNLILLCRECHRKIHWEAKEQALKKYNKRRRKRDVKNGLEFDENGNLVQKKDVFIVWGSPSAGKTHYVKENMTDEDIAIDLDYIKAALSLSDNTKKFNDYILDFAFDVRDRLYKAIKDREHYFEKCYVIACLPRLEDRLELKRELRAELIHIDTSERNCFANAKLDDNIDNLRKQYRITKKYWKEYEEG